MTRIEIERHAVEDVLADLGMLVRRARSGSLVEAEYVLLINRVHAGVAALGADADGMIGARLALLERLHEAGNLTERVFTEVTGLIRVQLLRFRDAEMAEVPNFAVLPTGVHGRRIGRLTVIQGGVQDPPQPTLKGA